MDIDWVRSIATTVVNEETGEIYDVDDGFDFIWVVMGSDFKRIKDEGAVPWDLWGDWAREFVRQVGKAMKQSSGDGVVDEALQAFVYDDVGDSMVNLSQGNVDEAILAIMLGKLRAGKKGIN